MYDFSIDILSMIKSLIHRKLFFVQILTNRLLFSVIHNSYFSFLFYE